MLGAMKLKIVLILQIMNKGSMEEVIKKWELILQQDSGRDITYGRKVLEEMLTDVRMAVKNCSIPPVMHSCRPKERVRNCPNCGELYWDSELNYSSTKRIDCDNGSFVSTLYGVCRKCAERHGA